MPSKKAVAVLGTEAQTKSVGIWIRVSTEDQARGESPEHHEKRARGYAEAKGWNVREVYHLEGVSGKAVLEHPEAQRMLADVKNGHIQALIFSKLARLARNTRELLDLSDSFRQYHADLVSLGESIDTSTPVGRLFYTMIAAMAQWEREEIASRVAASVEIRAKLGKPLGGAAPYGYRWEGKQLVVHPMEAPVRRLTYDLFLQHRRFKTVARLLNEKGYRTRRGMRFTDSTVERFLEDPVAKGKRRMNYTTVVDAKKNWEFKPEDQWVWVDVEPIISEETWDQVQTVLKQRQAKHRPIARRPVQLFAAITHCACGGKMKVPSNSPKYICQKCHNKIPIADLEAIFATQLANVALAPEEVASYLIQTDDAIVEKQKLLTSLEAEDKRVHGEMERIMRLFHRGVLSDEAVGAQYQPLFDRAKQLQDQIPTLQGELDFLKINKVSGDEILTEARDLSERWEGLDFDEKRQLVEQITEGIIVGKDEVEIRFCYLPNSTRRGPSGNGGGNSNPPSRGSSGPSGPPPNPGNMATNPERCPAGALVETSICSCA
jgi:site-specific DNA recombinase